MGLRPSLIIKPRSLTHVVSLVHRRHCQTDCLLFGIFLTLKVFNCLLFFSYDQYQHFQRKTTDYSLIVYRKYDLFTLLKCQAGDRVADKSRLRLFFLISDSTDLYHDWQVISKWVSQLLLDWFICWIQKATFNSIYIYIYNTNVTPMQTGRLINVWTVMTNCPS